MSAHTITPSLTHQNICTSSAEEVAQRVEKLYAKALINFSNYCEEKNGLAKNGKPKGLQNFTKLERTQHEFIYEINENTTLEQCEELTQKIAELTGFTPLQIAIHRDEQKNGKVHQHAHAVFFTLDEQGLQLARKGASLNPANLSKIQDLTAECLEMKRGKERYKNKEADPQYIQNYKDYARYKAQEEKLLSRIQEQEQELSKREQELDNREHQLEYNIEEHENERKALERGHLQQVEALEQKYIKKLSTIKNIFTLGRHNAKVREEFQQRKTELLANAKELKNTYDYKFERLQEQVEDLKVDKRTLEGQKSTLTRERNRYAENLQRAKDGLNTAQERAERNLSREQLKQIFPERAKYLEEQEQKISRSYENMRNSQKSRDFGFGR